MLLREEGLSCALSDKVGRLRESRGDEEWIIIETSGSGKADRVDCV